MIISENQVAVPGRKFKTKVTCVSTRRLTTIEWLLLSCTKKFSVPGSPSYRVKDVFEKVFQFQNSELLIKPCLRSLADLKVIEVNAGNAYDYANLSFWDISLTELGQVMLKDGLLPGERRDIPIEIYYNPLTGRITTSDWKNMQENVVEFGVESDYDLEFPKQRIIDGLQSGVVASGKFTAAKFRIEDIENLVGSEWTFVTDISIDLDDQGEIHTVPDILEESVYSKVNDLLKDYVYLNNNQPNYTEWDYEHIEGQSFSNLDRLGRCGTAVAMINREMMPTEKREAIGSVKPSGWIQNKYPGIVDSQPPYLYNRSHLIAYALTGENANELNLITGTRYFNASVMLPWEEKVMKYLDYSDNHVLYRVTPYFKGNELLSRGVEIEAYSVEDNGAGICFHIFAYNIQPGIELNYGTGENWLAQ